MQVIDPIDNEVVDCAKLYEGLTEQQGKFFDNYLLSNFHIGEACTRTGIARSTYYFWMKDTVFAQAYEDHKALILDMAESQLVNLLRQGDKDIVKFALTKLGKSRGYGDTLDITSGGKPFESSIQIILPSNNVDTE